MKEMRQITLDGTRMLHRDLLHSYLREQLELPEYYGKNLDALYDFLTEIGVDTEIQIVHGEGLWKSEGFGRSVLQVFREAAQDNDCLTLTERIAEMGGEE